MKKAALHNLGCKVNAYETEAMRQMLEEGGYEIVPFNERADVYVINTCSVTNIADRKSRQMLHRARMLNPDAVIVAAGCYVQAKKDQRLKTDPNYSDEVDADIVLGNNRKHELLERLEDFFREREMNGQPEICSSCAGDTEDQKDRFTFVSDINDRGQMYEKLSAAQPAEHTRAFVKIQDGCNQFCSYCIIPYVRGRVRSRSMESILEEVRNLAEHGYQEIVLTGIHLSSYGLLTQKTSPEQADYLAKTDMMAPEAAEGCKTEEICAHPLLGLLMEISKIEGIKRIRLGSLEPRILTEDFVQALAGMPKICPHFHISLQSGCDETLRRMNRRYTTREYEESCILLRKYFTNPAITTDVIVGFPQETEEEFAQTKEFLRHIHFYEMHVFKYSRRQGTAAARMSGQVSEQVKAQRSAELIAMEREMSEEYRRSWMGKTCSVLFEEKAVVNGEICRVGFTREYIRVAEPESKCRRSEGEAADWPDNNYITKGVISAPLQEGLYLLSEC